MGTRSSTKLKLRTPPFKCDICGRKLMSAESLKTHQLCIHSVANKLKTKPAPKQGIAKPKTQPQVQKVNMKFKVDKAKPLPTKKLPVTKPDNKQTVKMGKNCKIPIETRHEYECPKCFETFSVYFLAFRHIQKYHSVDCDCVKVSPNSPNIIKPDALVICARCNKRLKSLDSHKCTTYRLEQTPTTAASVHICMGCNEQFQSLRLFDLHVSGLHCDGVESMFFPVSEVFESWKGDVFKQNGVEYYELGNYNFKKMLRCPCIPDKPSGDISLYLCPSSIVVQELSKGIQVHFYKNHYGHTIDNYVLPDLYKKYTLTKLIQNQEAYTLSDDRKANDTVMYEKFTQLMACIVQDAANINIDTLKILVTKALDMTTVLSEENDSESNFQSIKMILDNEIQGFLTDENKRKSVIVKTIEPITKRFKTRTYQKDEKINKDSIKIINSYSLADDEIMNVINEDNQNNQNKEKITPEVSNSETNLNKEHIKNKLSNQSPTSFAESYKVFVKQLSQPGQPPLKKNKPLIKTKSKPIITEIGMKEEPPKDYDNDIPILPIQYKYEVKERENDCNILILKF